MSQRVLSFVLTGLFVLAVISPTARCEVPEASPRRTPTVRLIEKLEPTLVAIFTQGENGEGSTGSGALIHPQGFLLTCDHVVRDRSGVAIVNGKHIRPYRIVARLPEKDLSILQVAGIKGGPFSRLGRSDDIMTGEPILVAGNPGGRGIIFTQGIVSSKASVVDLPNVLAQVQIGTEFRQKFIQFDAASNRGNSGGPLFNILGQQIGVVSSKNYNEENINYAIPVDTLREHAAAMIAPEIRSGAWSGVEIDTSGITPVIKSIVKGSPADRGGLQAGDQIEKVNRFFVNDSIHWLLALMYREPGEELTIKYVRDKEHLEAKFKLEAIPALPQQMVEEKKRASGLHLKMSRGEFKQFPPTDELKFEDLGIVDYWDDPEKRAGLSEHFILSFEGFVDVPAQGPVQFVLGSDDGSRLWIDDQLVIDNGGHHPHQELSHWVSLEQGPHRIRLEFLEWVGNASLELQWRLGSEPDAKLVPVPKKALFHKVETQKAE